MTDAAAFAPASADASFVSHVDPADGAPREQRSRRLTDAIESAKVGGRRIDAARVPVILGSILAPLGLVMIGVAWHGVANTGLLFEQVPFLVSGGLGGLALVVLGGFLYFAWWHTVAIREARLHARQQEDTNRLLLEELRELRHAVEHLGSPAPGPVSTLHVAPTHVAEAHVAEAHEVIPKRAPRRAARSTTGA